MFPVLQTRKNGLINSAVFCLHKQKSNKFDTPCRFQSVSLRQGWKVSALFCLHKWKSSKIDLYTRPSNLCCLESSLLLRSIHDCRLLMHGVVHLYAIMFLLLTLMCSYDLWPKGIDQICGNEWGDLSSRQLSRLWIQPIIATLTYYFCVRVCTQFLCLCSCVSFFQSVYMVAQCKYKCNLST